VPEAKNIHCPHCRYVLNGLTHTENRVQCPECGRFWTNRELSPHWDGRRWWQRLRWQLLAGVPIAVALLTVAAVINIQFVGGVLLFGWYWGCISWRFIAITKAEHQRSNYTLFFQYLSAVVVGFVLTSLLFLFVAYVLSLY
jgi:hypothetical protein